MFFNQLFYSLEDAGLLDVHYHHWVCFISGMHPHNPELLRCLICSVLTEWFAQPYLNESNCCWMRGINATCRAFTSLKLSKYSYL